MLKVRHTIIYTVIATLLSSQIALAGNSGNETPPQVSQTINLLEHEGNATFYLPPEERAALEDSLKNPTSKESKILDEEAKEFKTEETLPAPTTPGQTLALARIQADTAQRIAKIDNGFMGNRVRAFITGATLLAITELHQRLHAQNLQYTPENIKQLSHDVAVDFSQMNGGLYGLADIPVVGGAQEVFGLAYKRSVGRAITNRIMNSVLESLIAGACFSIGLNYIGEFITASTKLVLDHGDRFGGVSADEAKFLKLLLTQNGISYFVSGFFKHNAVNRNASFKVMAAMHLMLMHDDQLLDTLWAHMNREALLKGKNITIAVMSVLSGLAAKKFVSDDMGSAKQHLLKGGMAIFFGIIGSELVIPSWVEDGETASMRNQYSAYRRWRRLRQIQQEPSILNALPDSLDRIHQLDSFVGKLRHLREDNLLQYASIMKLSLDRQATLVGEKAKVQKIVDDKTPGPQLSLSQSLAKWGTRIMGGDVLPYRLELKEDDWVMTRYQKLFQRATDNLINQYDTDIAALSALQSVVPASGQKRIYEEQENIRKMQTFVRYFAIILTQRWTALQPSLEYYSANQVLDQIAFWGLHENDIIQASNTSSQDAPRPLKP